MSNRAQSHFLKVYNASDSTVYARWQNYYVNQSVTLSSASWSYFPFVATGIMAATANGGAGGDGGTPGGGGGGGGMADPDSNTAGVGGTGGKGARGEVRIWSW